MYTKPLKISLILLTGSMLMFGAVLLGSVPHADMQTCPVAAMVGGACPLDVSARSNHHLQVISQLTTAVFGGDILQLLAYALPALAAVLLSHLVAAGGVSATVLRNRLRVWHMREPKKSPMGRLLYWITIRNASAAMMHPRVHVRRLT